MNERRHVGRETFAALVLVDQLAEKRPPPDGSIRISASGFLPDFAASGFGF
jgi:hypothetical protein